MQFDAGQKDWDPTPSPCKHHNHADLIKPNAVHNDLTSAYPFPVTTHPVCIRDLSHRQNREGVHLYTYTESTLLRVMKKDLGKVYT